jgi:hypothetical protein
MKSEISRGKSDESHKVLLRKTPRTEIGGPGFGSGASPKILHRNEWDFRPAPNPKKETKTGDWTAGIPYEFLPENEVYFCWQYEFSRYDSQSIEFYSKWRAGANKPDDFDSLLELYWLTDPDGKEGRSLVNSWFYRIWPEWPGKPYLSVPFKERQRRFTKTWERNPKRQLRLVPLREIYRYVVAVKAGKGPNEFIGRNTNGLDMQEEIWVISRGSPKEDRPPVGIAAFELDFGMTDEQLTRRFQNWLAQRRKDKGYRRPDRRASRVDRGDLIALGAMRLMDSGLGIEESMNYSQDLSGKALYQDAGDWTRARRRAERAIYRAS